MSGIIYTPLKTGKERRDWLTYYQDGGIPYQADDYPMAPASFENTCGIGALCVKDGSIEPASYSRAPDDEGYWALGGDYDPQTADSLLDQEEKNRILLSLYISENLPQLGDSGQLIQNNYGWIRGTGTLFATVVASGIFLEKDYRK